MVYMGNIFALHKELNENEIIVLRFTSGTAINKIYKTDELTKKAGDVVITRVNSLGRCITIIDPNEVEAVQLQTVQGEYYGN